MSPRIRLVVPLLLHPPQGHANNALWAVVRRHPRSLVLCGLYLLDTRALICFAGYILVIPMPLVASDGLCCFALVPPVTYRFPSSVALTPCCPFPGAAQQLLHLSSPRMFLRLRRSLKESYSNLFHGMQRRLIARQDYHDPNRRAYAFALAIASVV